MPNIGLSIAAGNTVRIGIVDLKNVVYVTAILFCFYLFSLVWFLDDLEFGLPTFSRAGAAITATLLTWTLIAKRLWKWPLIQWALGVPNLEGTWAGHLESGWSPGGSPGGTVVPIAFVVRQTLFRVVVTSYTETRKGYSIAASLVVDGDHDNTRLVYVYRLEEAFAGASAAQKGAADLDCDLRDGGGAISGNYWTDDNKAGKIILNKLSDNLVKDFNSAASIKAPRQWVKF